jgi:hypothetical protein
MHNQGRTWLLGSVWPVVIPWKKGSLIGNEYLLYRGIHQLDSLTEGGSAGAPGGEYPGIVRIAVEEELRCSIIVGSSEIGLSCADSLSLLECGVRQSVDSLGRFAPLLIPALEIPFPDMRGRGETFPNISPSIRGIADGS